MSQRRFVLLDRDGTIIVERHYLSDPEAVELLPGAASGLRRLRELGLGLAVVTNQSAVGRGYFDEARLQQIHERMCQLLRAEQIELDGIYFCPHVPDDQCSCRKPETGMAQAAAKELDFEARDCFVIGDKLCDIAMGQSLGATTLLVLTGYGEKTNTESIAEPNFVVTNLDQAADVIEPFLNLSDRSLTNERAD